MRALFAGRRRQILATVGIAAAFILFRSAVWIFFEQSHFDSDQAVVGLMAKNLAEGRAFPLFFYGQHYMLAVEPWLVAPVFRLFGASIIGLKLPLMGINLVIAAVLLWMLAEKVGLAPIEALVVSVFFIATPPLVSARFVEAQGSNIEPLLYVLVLWLLRDRPILFGLFAGFAFLHREFAMYAIAGVLLLDVLTGRAFSRERLRGYAMSWGMFALVAFVVSVLKTKADLLGPGSAGTMNLGSDAQIASWGGLVCWNPAERNWNIHWLFHENLGMIFNWNPDMLGPEDWTRTPAGHGWLEMALVLMGVVALFEIVRRRKNIGPSGQFGVYLMAVAAQAALFYAVLSCHVRDMTLIRYTLLTLYFPIGLLVLFFLAKPAMWARAVVITLVLVWGASSTLDNGRFLAAYLHKPPTSPARDLSNYLEAQGVRYGRGTYWIAYQLDFLSQERMTISSLEKVRVLEYQKIVDDHDQQAVHIRPNPGWPNRTCEDGITFRLWCLQYFERAKNVVPPRLVYLDNALKGTGSESLMSDLFQELEWRGQVANATEGARELLSREKVAAYSGFDPTAASLHVGNLVPIMVLKRLQQFGHTPIALIGGGTGLIGDPSGKSIERVLLSKEDVQRNVDGIRAQLSKLLAAADGGATAKFVDNAEWLGKMSAMEFLRDVGKYFTVNYLLAKESVKRRLESEDGISYTEFSYSLLQAYDFLVLHDKFNCTLQVGGSDQWGNIVAGCDLIRKLRGKAAQAVVMPLLTTATGTKFGKTEAGTVWLDPALTSPFRFYQFWLNVDDRDVVGYLKCFTFRTQPEIGELESALKAHPERREAQRALARDVTEMVHGPDHVTRAERAAAVLFGGSLADASVDDILLVFDDAPSITMNAAALEVGVAATELAVSTGLAASKAEAGRLIKQGGLYVNDRRFTEERGQVTLADAIGNAVIVLRKGQRERRIVKIQP